MPKKNAFNANEYQVKFESPTGEAKWACLKTPKVWTEGEKGNYQISLMVPKEEAQDLIDQCVAMRDRIAQIIGEGDDVRMSPYDPWKEDGDQIEFRFKKPHFPANDKFPASRPVPTYLEDGSKVDWDNTEWAVGNGSTVKIGGFIRPYYVGTMGLGITLRLGAVKVYKLEKYTGATEDFGFGSDTSSDGNEEEFAASDF